MTIGAIIAILIGAIIFDLDAWGIALAVLFCLLFAGLMYGS